MRNNDEKNLEWFPTKEQELLLKIALLKDERIIEYWKRIKEEIAFENLDIGSQRLLPLVYDNLQSFGVKDQHTHLLKIRHRTTHRDNLLLFNKAEIILNSLHKANIETLVLKGVALSNSYYKSNALRPMADIDLLVKKKDIWKTFEILKAEKWIIEKEARKNLPLYVDIFPSCQFTHQIDKYDLDLHWQIMRDCCNSNNTEFMWADAVPVSIGNEKTLALSPTHQLFHICWHGARYNPVPPIRWIPDAVMILRKAEQDIEWDKLISAATLYRVNMSIAAALKYLKKNFISTIPTDVLQTLENRTFNKVDDIYQEFRMTRNSDWVFKDYAKETFFQYKILTSSTDLNPKFLAYLKYLQYYLDAKSFWQVPPKLLVRAFQIFILSQNKSTTE